MAKFFEKCKNNLAILGPFYPNLSKNEFFPIIYHNAKNQQKLLSNFWGKHQTDGQLQAAASLKIYDSITSGTFTRI